ncbi:MAG: hypothetical protein JKY13_01660 [Gammaproteobacteria bacterium]|nr:hypothetical protein [Gammaproteobacteria bacterium]
MSKYVRCRKDNSQIIGDGFDNKPEGLPHTTIFWVEVADAVAFPAKYSLEDVVRFSLTDSLVGVELTCVDLIKQESDGSWQHTQTLAEGNITNNQARIAEVDAETFTLIQEWCSLQSEGCEEAFMNKGIDDNTDVRYLAYRTQRGTIVTAQNQKKIDEGLV